MKFTLLFLFITLSLSAQIKGIVVDENNKPIPYVNIWVENKNIGTTSEENGEFIINAQANERLFFSAMGFEKKTVDAKDAKKVVLKEDTFALDEVVIVKKYESKQLEIGTVKNETFQAFDNGPRIDAKFFAYNPVYSKTKFIKKVSIFTDSQLEEAVIKIHFYNVDSNGFPGEELLKKDYIVTLKKGVIKNSYNILDFNLKIPQNGIFVAFEKLIIERNKKEKTITDSNTGKTIIQRIYYPFVLYNYVDRESLFTFYGGKWNKQSKQSENGKTEIMKVFEPAIYLTLTN